MSRQAHTHNKMMENEEGEGKSSFRREVLCEKAENNIMVGWSWIADFSASSKNIV